MNNLKSKLYLYIVCILSLSIHTPASSGDFRTQIIDPQDGRFDVSQYLLENTYGFLPVPFIVTEPAVGYGLGVAAAFFHDTEEKRKTRMEQSSESGDDDIEFIPPSVSVGVGLYTENNSWVVGGGHFGSWKQDRYRYTGAAGYGDLNLKFYEPVTDSGLNFNIQGLLFSQELQYRLGHSDWFIGGRYDFSENRTNFDISSVIPGIDPLDFDSSNAAVTAILSFDSRNNIFAPVSGNQFTFEAESYSESFGGDFDYQEYSAANYFYSPLSEKVFFGLRTEANTIFGDAPFYALPFIELRGIPAMRYQDNSIGVVEVELRFQVDDRWSINTFGGAGRAADDLDDISDAESRWAGGGGFRYLIARELGLQAGIDIAVGPEDTVLYIGMGTGW